MNYLDNASDYRISIFITWMISFTFDSLYGQIIIAIESFLLDFYIDLFYDLKNWIIILV